MAFESFAKALYEKSNKSKRKIMNGLGNYADILGHLFTDSGNNHFLQFQLLTFSLLMSLMPLTFHIIWRIVYQANRDDNH